MKKNNLFIIVFFSLFLLFSLFLNNFNNFNNLASNTKVGVIDGVIRQENLEKYNIKEYKKFTNLLEEKSSLHGEKILDIISKENNSDIYYASVEEDNGTVNLEGVINAIYYLKNKNVDIINMSLCFIDDDPKLKKAIEEAQENGIVIISANSNLDIESYPAEYNNVISASLEYSSLDYKGLIKVNKYQCTSYNTALLTNYVSKNKIYNKNIKNIIKILKEEF